MRKLYCYFSSISRAAAGAAVSSDVALYFVSSPLRSFIGHIPYLGPFQSNMCNNGSYFALPSQKYALFSQSEWYAFVWHRRRQTYLFDVQFIICVCVFLPFYQWWFVHFIPFRSLFTFPFELFCFSYQKWPQLLSPCQPAVSFASVCGRSSINLKSCEFFVHSKPNRPISKKKKEQQFRSMATPLTTLSNDEKYKNTKHRAHWNLEWLAKLYVRFICKCKCIASGLPNFSAGWLRNAPRPAINFKS